VAPLLHPSVQSNESQITIPKNSNAPMKTQLSTKKYRKHIERFINLDHLCLTPGTKAMLEGKEKIVENMKTKLAKKQGLY
jgi:hypothetical protein